MVNTSQKTGRSPSCRFCKNLTAFSSIYKRCQDLRTLTGFATIWAAPKKLIQGSNNFRSFNPFRKPTFAFKKIKQCKT